MSLPCRSPGLVVQMQTNMAASLNIDWVLGLAADVSADTRHEISHRDLVERIEAWLDASRPGQIVYLPYISEAGERGPFANANARAGFVGLSANHRYPDLVRAVVEGLALRYARLLRGDRRPCPRNCAFPAAPRARRALRGIFAAAVQAPVRVSSREEAGAAGAAMMAAVAIGAYPDMDACIAEWVTPLLGAGGGARSGARRRLRPPLSRLSRRAPRTCPGMGRSGGARRDAHEAMPEERDMTETGLVDLFVIGGGINGAGIARDAAGRGLSVVLCEKDDLAEGTSSRSGKLVHGGLRYLEYYEFRLVREALIEREVLLKAAPHIIWPMRFVLPHSPEDRPAWLVRLGPVPLRSSRRPQAASRHADARPQARSGRDSAARSVSRAASNIRTAGWTTPGSWSSTRSMPRSAARWC